MYRIFVVEDDRTIAREVCRLAESWGMEAKSAEDLRAVAAEAAEYGAASDHHGHRAAVF